MSTASDGLQVRLALEAECVPKADGKRGRALNLHRGVQIAGRVVWGEELTYLYD